MVYAVWFNMIPSDRRDRWNPDRLYDDRVTHFWDEGRLLGTWISQHVDRCDHLGAIDWDSYYLFDGDAKWTDTFEGVKACGTPIYRTVDDLAVAAGTLFETGTDQ